MGETKSYFVPIKNFELEKTKNNEQFLKTTFYAISEGDNLNRSAFTFNSLTDCVQSKDTAIKPILASWDKDNKSESEQGNFGGHDSDIGWDSESGEIYNTYLGEKSERPIGVILPETARIENIKGKQWLVFDGVIWQKYNREIVNLLKRKRKNNVSVEIEVLESEEDDRGVEIIDKFSLLGITIISKDTGIADACLHIMDFAKLAQCQQFVRAFSSAFNGEDKNDTEVEEDLSSDDKYGTGEKLELDLSKESASDDDWGEISKTELRNELLKAENYEDLIPKSYLVVLEYWEDAPSERLKYPIVQIKDGKVVFNTKGVIAASSYLVKEKDEPYFKIARAKLNKVREILGMEKLYAIETNNNNGNMVSQDLPNIIKMENSPMRKEELLERLSAVDKDIKDILSYKAEIEQRYEEQLGEYTYAEDDQKEEIKAEMEKSQEAIAQCDNSVEEKKQEVYKIVEPLMSADFKFEEDLEEEVIEEETDNLDEQQIDDEQGIDDDACEDTCDDICEDEVEDELYRKEVCELCGGKVLSITEHYTVYEKDGKILCAKIEKCEDETYKLEECGEVEKAYLQVIRTGGALSQEDTLPLPPVSVEITQGIKDIYKEIDEKEREVKVEKEKDNKYREDLKGYIEKLKEIIRDELIDIDDQSKFYDNIIDEKYANCEELEKDVKSFLFEKAKNVGFISGLFAPTKIKSNNNQSATELRKQYK